jgi:hypothetical protein
MTVEKAAENNASDGELSPSDGIAILADLIADRILKKAEIAANPEKEGPND